MKSLACTLALLAMAPSLVRADEENVPLDKLPKPVVDAVKQRFPKAELVKASKEVENGKTEYEVTVKDNGVKIDVTLTPEGKITGLEKELAVKDLPKAVRDALEVKYPKADYKSAEEIVEVKNGKEVLESYEVVLVTADKKKLEVVVSPEGKITKTEQK